LATELSSDSFWRAANERFETATILLEQTQRYTDTIYIGGYAVECALKSLILRRTSKAKLPAAIEEITGGAISHNFEYLARHLRLRNSLPEEVRRLLHGLGNSWSTDLRYSGHLTREEPARDFINRVESVLEWVRRSR
jgi:HEPN domain-containing protein